MPAEVSVNDTVSGIVPLVGEALKLALSVPGVMVFDTVMLSDPLVTVSLTIYVPAVAYV